MCVREETLLNMWRGQSPRWNLPAASVEVVCRVLRGHCDHWKNNKGEKNESRPAIRSKFTGHFISNLLQITSADATSVGRSPSC